MVAISVVNKLLSVNMIRVVLKAYTLRNEEVKILFSFSRNLTGARAALFLLPPTAR